MYMVMSIKKEIEVEVNFLGHRKTGTLPLSQMYDGCCGVLMIFKTKKAAKAYAGNKFLIVEVKEVANATA
jgi:hypothetical protein